MVHSDVSQSPCLALTEAVDGLGKQNAYWQVQQNIPTSIQESCGPKVGHRVFPGWKLRRLAKSGPGTTPRKNS